MKYSPDGVRIRCTFRFSFWIIYKTFLLPSLRVFSLAHLATFFPREILPNFTNFVVHFTIDGIYLGRKKRLRFPVTEKCLGFLPQSLILWSWRLKYRTMFTVSLWDLRFSRNPYQCFLGRWWILIPLASNLQREIDLYVPITAQNSWKHLRPDNSFQVDSEYLAWVSISGILSPRVCSPDMAWQVTSSPVTKSTSSWLYIWFWK